MIDIVKVGNFIMNRRKELGMTQQLAEKLNISFQAVSKWEIGGEIGTIESYEQKILFKNRINWL